MATESKTGYTYADLERFPEDNVRREVIDGELFVTPSPTTRHQRAIMALGSELYNWIRTNGGEVFGSPLDVFFSEANVVEPDILFVRREHAERVERRSVRGAPDVVVEVSSPSTRRTDQVRKRALYERFGVPEFWFVDLDADRIEIHRLEGGRYASPRLLFRGDVLHSPEVPGFGVPVDLVLGEPDDEEDGGP